MLFNNKALMITGARQVGKTYIIREFLKENIDDKYWVEFNLFENDMVKEIIENSKNSKDLLFRLSALCNKELVKGKTIIFLDEVQCSANIITAIKFLVEEGSYKYILSGSLLGTELKDIKSIPVGYLDILQMFPMDFEEFLIGNELNLTVLKRLKDNFETLTRVDNIIHEKLIDMFHLYLIVGGMPSVVNEYLKTNN